MLPLLPTTIAGSLPKPKWLAEPEKLWAPWKLDGEALAQGKRALDEGMQVMAARIKLERGIR